MTTTLSRTAWILCAVTGTLVLAQAALLVAADVPLLSLQANDDGFPLIPVAIMVGAVVGAAIVARHPRHRVGWLLCLGQVGSAAGLAAHALALAVLTGTPDLPVDVAHVSLWLAHLFGATYALALLGLLLALVPDGALLSRSWLPVSVLLLGGLALTAVGLLLIPPRLLRTDGSSGAVSPLATAVELTGQIAISLGLAGAAVSLIVRRRRSSGIQRQQLRWIGAAATGLTVALVVLVADNIVRGGGTAPWYLSDLFYLGYLAVPAATGLAVLRHRLYDIDAILGRTVWLVVLAVFVTSGYVAAVVAIGTLVGGSAHALWPSLAAYVVVALAFQPLRRRVDRIADRVAYGRRAGPYESLAALSRQLDSRSLSDSEVLLLVARSTGLALGARWASAAVSVPGGAEITAAWPDGEDHPPDAEVPVIRDGRTAGFLRVGLRPGHRLTRGQRRVLEDFAGHAALAFDAIALTTALRDRAEALASQRAELAASRRRLVTAGDLERERLATAMRARVSVRLQDVPAVLDRLADEVVIDPAAVAVALRRLQQTTTDSLAALRELTAGMLPPLLARRGLAPAVQALSDRSGRGQIVVDERVRDQRFDPSVEAAAYLACVVALSVMRPDAELTLDRVGDALLVHLLGRWSGDLPDRQQLVDRVGAVGGELVERASAAGVHELHVEIPLAFEYRVTRSATCATGADPAGFSNADGPTR